MRYIAILSLLLLISAGPTDDGRWYAGGYSFSDELGGFRILSVTGTGTRADPIEVTQHFGSAIPVTLIIRVARTAGARRAQTSATSVPGYFHMRVVAVNGSGLPWIAFDFELQSVLGEPSDFYDGLSFDQISRNPDFVSSDRFFEVTSDFEPEDRLRFSGGHVDPADAASFRFFITNFVNPRSEFYLVQKPHIPLS